MKSILGLIALIFIALAAYAYMEKGQETVPTKTKATEVKEVSHTESIQKVSKKKSSVKNTTVKSPKVVSRESPQEMKNEEEIGKGLTLEGIENADVSDEEKERLQMDMVYYQGLHNQANRGSPLTNEEVLEIIKEDLKAGRI